MFKKEACETRSEIPNDACYGLVGANCSCFMLVLLKLNESEAETISSMRGFSVLLI